VELLGWLTESDITPYMRTRQRRRRGLCAEYPVTDAFPQPARPTDHNYGMWHEETHEETNQSRNKEYR